MGAASWNRWSSQQKGAAGWLPPHPIVVLAGPGLRAPRCQAINASLAGDPSEVTALGKRHWITSFRWVDGNINIGGESAPVKARTGGWSAPQDVPTATGRAG